MTFDTCRMSCQFLSSRGQHASFFILFSVASAPTNLIAVQEGPTGIQVSWTPPTPLGDTTGYRIYYSGGSSGSVDVSGGSTDNHLLTGLQNGVSYTISIVGTSEHFFSNRVDYPNSISLSELLYNRDYYDGRWMSMNLFSPTSWPAEYHCECNNSHHHLPLLECSQWLSGGQLCGGVGEKWQCHHH